MKYIHFNPASIRVRIEEGDLRIAYRGGDLETLMGHCVLVVNDLLVYTTFDDDTKEIVVKDIYDSVQKKALMVYGLMDMEAPISLINLDETDLVNDSGVFNVKMDTVAPVSGKGLVYAGSLYHSRELTENTVNNSIALHKELSRFNERVIHSREDTVYNAATTSSRSLEKALMNKQTTFIIKRDSGDLSLTLKSKLGSYTAGSFRYWGNLTSPVFVDNLGRIVQYRSISQSDNKTIIPYRLALSKKYLADIESITIPKAFTGVEMNESEYAIYTLE